MPEHHSVRVAVSEIEYYPCYLAVQLSWNIYSAAFTGIYEFHYSFLIIRYFRFIFRMQPPVIPFHSRRQQEDAFPVYITVIWAGFAFFSRWRYGQRVYILAGRTFEITAFPTYFRLDILTV